jgi:Zn-dependent M28 family amino/carboxypeptidase
MIFKHVKEELSGTVAKSFVAQISRFHRIQGSTMFHEAAEYVKNEATRLGLKDAVIEQFPADGKTAYWTYTSPVGWMVKSAELRLIEPEEKLICTYEDCPQSLHTFSNTTPAEGVTAELVDVGSGTKQKDYEGKDVKGRFVLATGRAKLVHEQAVYKHGALGVLTDAITYEMPNVRESLDIPDAHAYQAIWPTASELDKVAFGFSLSKRQGNSLRALLKSGKTVKLKATVDAQFFAGHEEVITATIEGKSKPSEEVFLIAHLCHPKPSANDNASGAGLLLEIARTIRILIDSGKIEPPARTIRFIWVPETLGTVAYLSHHEEVRSRFVAGINLDMVGQNQELCRSTLTLHHTPDSLPSYLHDLVYSLMEQSVEEFDSRTRLGQASTFRYGSFVFSGGSDHAEFTEASIGVPCVMLLQWPDLYYHTNMDTIDNVSEDMLKRVGWIAAVATLALANADVETAYWLANQTSARATTRIAEATQKGIDELFRKKENQKIADRPNELAKTAYYYESKLEHIVWREPQAIQSVRRLGETSELNAHLDRLCNGIADLGQREMARLEEALSFVAKALNITIPQDQETSADKELKKLVPKRLFRGTLSSDLVKKELGEEEYEWYLEIDEKDAEFGRKMTEILNFMDGKRNAYEIMKAVSAEYTPTNAEHALKFLRDLEKTKLITFL